MKLTGKCKEEFLKWLDVDRRMELHLPDVYLNALIIEFFDSVGIYISTNPSTCYTEFDFHLDLSNNKEFSSVYNKDTGVLFYNCKSRTQATNEAIIKANEIFNLNNK